MKRGMIRGLLVVFGVLIMINIASAAIFVGQPGALYNVGDEFTLGVTLSPSEDVSGYLTAKLVCQEGSVELYKSPVSVVSGDQKDISISTTLSDSFIGNLTGTCLIRIDLEGEQVDSQTFEISSKANVYLEVAGIYFEPGKEVQVSGKATKANGNAINGYIQTVLSDLGLDIVRQVENGVFNFNFSVPENAKSGVYLLQANVYEKDEDGNAINYGKTSVEIRVNQVPKGIDVALSKQTIIPGEEMNYGIVLNDQAGDKISEDATLTIYSPDDSVFDTKIVKAGETYTWATKSNYAPGYWKIEAKARGLESKKMIYFESLEKASFRIANGTLIVVNEGNVPYNKPVQVSVGGKNRVIENLNINVNEEKSVKLTVSKNGEYTVVVNDGATNSDLGATLLTGRAIDYGEFINGQYSPIFWVVVVLILAVLVYYFYRKAVNRRYVGSVPRASSGAVRLMTASADENKLVDSGHRGEATVIALKIGNIEEIKGADSNAASTIKKAFDKIKANGGKIYADGVFRIIVFSQMVTKEADNNLRAVKMANEIASMLSDYNKKYGHRIDFGIGVNNGEMVGEVVGGSIKYTPIGNTVILAKRIADGASETLLLSGAVHRRVLGAVKCDKHGDYWKVNSIANRDRHSGFIEGFMKRQEPGKGFFPKK